MPADYPPYARHDQVAAYVAPPEREIRAQMTRGHDSNKRQFYAWPRHTMEVDFDRYLWHLARERKRGSTRAATRTGPEA